jgi:hypothetical protein
VRATGGNQHVDSRSSFVALPRCATFSPGPEAFERVEPWDRNPLQQRQRAVVRPLRLPGAAVRPGQRYKPSECECEAKLWVGAAGLGFFRRTGKTSRFEAVKPNLHAVHFDVRDSFVIACDDMIAGTVDGKDFFATGDGWLANLRAGHPLCDF